MGKKNVTASKDERLSFPSYKSYSVDEVLAAGGTTAFAEKLGKDPNKIIDRLKHLPKDVFLTEEEFEAAMKTLKAAE